MAGLEQALVAQWYVEKSWGWLLWPLSQLFGALVRFRKFLYDKGIFAVYKAQVPVIVVGNITVGGTGKTPLVLHLAQLLQKRGYRPGVVTRGYKGSIDSPILVSPNSDPKMLSDEAVMLAKRAHCPVMIAKHRRLAVKQLVENHRVNVIISDDGLQHYALHRDIEIAVVDGDRGAGNGQLLPMGPLREPLSRLNTVDMVVVNGGSSHDDSLYKMKLECDKIYNMHNPMQTVNLAHFFGKTVHAIAGIGNPDRFFSMLKAHGINVIPHPFPDHHAFSPADVLFVDALPVLMTDKDAVKCSHFANQKHWVVVVEAVLADIFEERVLKLLTDVNTVSKE